MSEPVCTCGHVEDEHDRGECTIDGCGCFAFEEDTEPARPSLKEDETP